MGILQSWAYDYGLGPFPLVALLGFATYALFLATATLTALKPRSKLLRRLPVKVHRRLAIVAIVFGAAHLVLGLSTYI